MTRILVVDDLRSDREVMTSMLSKVPSWSVETAVDGRDALAQVEASPPDAIVTDIQMPNMDGFGLVAAIREHFAQLPVVLVTAKGSEETAMRALREGASNYVPKDQMARNLVETVQHVIKIAAKNKDQARLLSCLRRHERRMEFEVENDRDLLAPLVSYLQETVVEMGVCNESESLQVGMALDEALVNALYHGNLEVSSRLKEDDDRAYYDLARKRAAEAPYCNRRIRVRVDLTSDSASFTMADDGPGFDPKSLPDPTDPENLLKVHGRGILLMRTFMDDVQFSSSGNQVTLVKRRSA